MPVTMTALALGGNVRLGFEDNIFLHKGVKAKENAELVGRVARLAGEWDSGTRHSRRGAPDPQAGEVRERLSRSRRPDRLRSSPSPPSVDISILRASFGDDGF